MSTESPQERWRLVVPHDAMVVMMTDDNPKRVATRINALPPTSRVALVGGRRHAIRVARRSRLKVEREYVVIPSLQRPVAIAQKAPESLRWFARSILTVPPGRSRFHGIVWGVIKVIRWRPGLLARAPVGDRILIGVRQ